ncbi:uncharacterized protein LOC113351704 [Papaver somniferum]|uniref:uncharacterized protein LOC113351704 n=1 Tax=Papaver somniferum TaxID=3469 RepID=UPI000E6F4EED|nr:uncharacterized protein LOC113351704 [Papaver somniferum]
MEAFSKMIFKLEGNCLYEGFRVRHNGTQVSHLLFADDTLVFSSDSVQQIHYISASLICFRLCSGLSINAAKSTAVGMGETHCQQPVVSSLGCTITDFPIPYLGMPVGASYRCRRIWDAVIENFEARLQGWMGRCLTYGGRLILIKFVLSAIAIFMMTVYSMPKFVAKRLNGIM